MGDTIQHDDDVFGTNKSKKLKEDLKNLLLHNESLVAKLNELIEGVQTNHQNCLIAKTTGISVGAVGTTMVVGGWIAGLVLAVPTFGLSLTVPAVMTIAGTATAVAGGLTAAGTEIANGIITKQFLNELTNIQELQAVAAKEIEATLEKIKYIVTELQKDEEENDSLAITLVVQGIKSEEVDLDDIDESIRKLKLKLMMLNPDKINEYSIGSVVSGGTRVVGAAFDVTNAVVTSGSVLVDDVAIAVLRSLGIGTTSAVAVGALRGMAASVGVIFTIIDIVGLVKDYTDPNPLLKELKRIKELFLKDIDSCQNLLYLFE